MIDFRMPSLGADMDAGTLVEWYRKPGETVRRGDVVALVETQKGAIEVEVFHDGTIGTIEIEPGHKVPVGTVLATIVEAGEEAAPVQPAPEQPASDKPAPDQPAPTQTVAVQPVAAPEQLPEPSLAAATTPALPAQPPWPPLAAVPPAGLAGRLKVSPAARRRASQSGLDLKEVAPGPDGVIGLRELPSAAAATKTEPRRAGLDLGEMRKAIAAAMTRSHREIPHYWVSRTIDVTTCLSWLEARNASRPVAERMLYAAPLIKAVALALKETPALNGQWSGDEFRPSEAVHLGIATALRGGGLVAPALRDADRLDVEAIMAALSDLVPRARSGRMRSSELTDATATLSNLGEDTSDQIMPLIYPPQVAIVGCGGTLERPFVSGGAVAVRRVMTVTLAGDHRVSDGRLASRFLSRLDHLLQEPETL